MWSGERKKWRLLSSSPFSDDVELPGTPIPKERYLTRREVERPLEAEAMPHIRLATLLMLTTAGRVPAILELTWGRVDFTRRQINLRTGDGLRKGRAIVPMNETIHAALLEARRGALSDHVIEWAAKPVKSIKGDLQEPYRSLGSMTCLHLRPISR